MAARFGLREFRRSRLQCSRLWLPQLSTPRQGCFLSSYDSRQFFFIWLSCNFVTRLACPSAGGYRGRAAAQCDAGQQQRGGGWIAVRELADPQQRYGHGGLLLLAGANHHLQCLQWLRELSQQRRYCAGHGEHCRGSDDQPEHHGDGALHSGTYYVWVIADNTSVLSQSNTSNDFAVSSAFTVTVAVTPPGTFTLSNDPPTGIPKTPPVLRYSCAGPPAATRPAMRSIATERRSTRPVVNFPGRHSEARLASPPDRPIASTSSPVTRQDRDRATRSPSDPCRVRQRRPPSVP